MLLIEVETIDPEETQQVNRISGFDENPELARADEDSQHRASVLTASRKSSSTEEQDQTSHEVSHRHRHSESGTQPDASKTEGTDSYQPDTTENDSQEAPRFNHYHSSRPSENLEHPPQFRSPSFLRSSTIIRKKPMFDPGDLDMPELTDSESNSSSESSKASEEETKDKISPTALDNNRSFSQSSSSEADDTETPKNGEIQRKLNRLFSVIEPQPKASEANANQAHFKKRLSLIADASEIKLLEAKTEKKADSSKRRKSKRRNSTELNGSKGRSPGGSKQQKIRLGNLVPKNTPEKRGSKRGSFKAKIGHGDEQHGVHQQKTDADASFHDFDPSTVTRTCASDTDIQYSSKKEPE